jgi:hypothetical protein
MLLHAVIVEAARAPADEPVRRLGSAMAHGLFELTAQFPLTPLPGLAHVGLSGGFTMDAPNSGPEFC